jgi:hypothetical protein
VIIPEYIVGHWWEQLLHNQSALRLKARLLFQPGVVIIDVPWHLRSAGVTPAQQASYEQQAAAAEHQPGHPEKTPPAAP